MSDCDCQEPCENHPAFLDGATAPGTDGPSAPQEGCPHCGLLTCWEWRAKQAEGKLRRMEGMYHDAVERGALAESEALASHSLSLGGEDKEERGPYADDGNCCQWCGWMTCAGLEGCHGRGGRTEPEDKVEGEGRRSAAGVADADLVRVGDFFGIPAFTHPDVKPGIVGIVSAGEVTAVIADREEPTPYAKAFRERVCPVPEFPSVGTARQEAVGRPSKDAAPVPQTEGGDK